MRITPTLERWLSYHVVPGSGGGPKVSGSREAPVPIRLDVLDHVAHIEHILKSWVWLTAEHRGLLYPTRMSITALALWLGQDLEWPASRPWVGDMCDEFAGLRRTAHALAPWRVQVDYLTGPCPSCDLRALIQVAGETYIECDLRAGGCNSLWTGQEYHRRVKEIADEHQATTMLTMARRHPGRLPPAEQRAEAERDLQTVAEEYAKAKQAADEAYQRAMAEPTTRLHAAIRVAAAPPEGVPAAEKKSLVTRNRISEITGIPVRVVQRIVNEGEAS
ncbi:hypothetical protein ACIA8R_29700 [Nonomuraea sp. NPDC051191]|uniref:hypothetical protein n=1 Tax=Nonomuraea sp. NPDC051191 TaxID=3364372 RepID=UPI0037BC7BAF